MSKETYTVKIEMRFIPRRKKGEPEPAEKVEIVYMQQIQPDDCAKIRAAINESLEQLLI